MHKKETDELRDSEKLPKTAQNYVVAVEKAIECPIPYVSVGQEREALILR